MPPSRRRGPGRPTDVTEAGRTGASGAAAIARFNRIDVWINNAGIGAVGAFDDHADGGPRAGRGHRPGRLHARRPRGAAALQGPGPGTLINVLSLGSWAPTPYAAAYSAAKFGLRGFTDALRGELSAWRDIHVCDVHPSFVDTPGMQHGGNYVGRQLKPPPGWSASTPWPAPSSPHGERPRRQVVVGKGVTAMARTARFLAPGATVATMARLLEAYFAVGRRASRSGQSVRSFATMGASGGWRRPGAARRRDGGGRPRGAARGPLAGEIRASARPEVRSWSKA
jgi:short-subunit dehydrogenase